MKTSPILLLAVGLLVSCAANKDDYYGGYEEPEGFSGIIDPNATNQLSTIIFTVDLNVNDSLYLLANSLFEVEVYLNNHLWGIFSSSEVDTTALSSVKYKSDLISDKPVEYLFVTNDQSTLDTLETAGDFSKALRNVLSLAPGDYIAEIRSVSWKNRNDEITRQAVRDLIPFTLETGTSTLYLGTFNSEAKL